MEGVPAVAFSLLNRLTGIMGRFTSIIGKFIENNRLIGILGIAQKNNRQNK